MNDDQDRELFGLPPSRQQRTPLKALEALGDENFTHTMSGRQLPFLRGPVRRGRGV